MGKKEKETDYLILSIINLRNRVEAKRNNLIKIGGENLKFCFKLEEEKKKERKKRKIQSFFSVTLYKRTARLLGSRTILSSTK